MKILMVDKYHFVKGGAERYFFELKKILEAKGHQVIPFAMQHSQNVPDDYEKYFVSNVEFNQLSPIQKLLEGPKILSRIIYSVEAKKAVAKLIEDTQPDIAHIHMIDHQISPSILHAFRDHNLPVLQTCHQYKLVCPSYRLFVMHKNQLCEKCVHGSFYHAVLERCHKNSLGASAMVALESYIHRWLRIHNLIDMFHVPSRFLGQKLIEGGFPKEKIWHSFYTINLDDFPFHESAQDYAIYYGRLSEEKGVLTLLKAIKLLKNVRVKIVGDGPDRERLEAFAERGALRRVSFCGELHGKDLVSVVQNCRFVIVPSEWYDNSPLVIYEAFSMGKPVIVSKMGGMPELVTPNHDGLHFDAGDVQMLASQMQMLWADQERCRKMGRNGREKAELEFAPEAHYRRILEVYESLRNSAEHTESAPSSP